MKKVCGEIKPTYYIKERDRFGVLNGNQLSSLGVMIKYGSFNNHDNRITVYQWSYMTHMIHFIKFLSVALAGCESL